MFRTIKERVEVERVISHFLQNDLKKIGENLTTDDDVCPFCGHKECFRIKPESDKGDGFYHCFSCGVHGDCIQFVQALKELDTPVQAAKLIAEEFKIQLPSDVNPIQEVFALAARYYKICMDDGCNKPYPELKNLTPLEYQLKTRGHTQATIDKLQIGWSDGNLVTYLRGVGIEDSIILESGLMNKNGKDFLPAKVFIYPHFVKGKVSHFTFKDPLKKLAYQLKNTSKLNGHSWYNQDAIGLSDTVILVEGENDLASILDAGTPNVIASIGQLAGSQVDWLVENFEGKSLITIFDPDAAGDKYREKINKVRHKFKNVKQIVPPEDKDIDELLREGKNLKELLETSETVSPTELMTEEEAEEDRIISKADDTGIVVKDNCYYKVRYKEGEPTLTRISNFVVNLQNVFVREDQRTRDVVLVRQDGKTSRPVQVTSETKTSVKSFRTFAANVIDGFFTGSETDLVSMWEYIYSGQTEREIHLIDHIGKNEHGWMFNNIMITNSGRTVEMDADGTFWQNNKVGPGARGIKAISINGTKGADENLVLPSLNIALSKEENNEFLTEFTKALGSNLSHAGGALAIMAWSRAVAYSEWFIKKFKHFPFLFFIGVQGGGKTTIMEWVLEFYGMSNVGITSLPNVRSPVALERKIAYYSHLPLCIDEMRNNPQTVQYWGMFRGIYNRMGRELGTNDDITSIKQLKVRSCLFFGGQDIPTDPALRTRFIVVKIDDPKINKKRETIKSYAWIKNNIELLPSLGYHWILESRMADLGALKDKIEDTVNVFRMAGISNRYSFNFAFIKVMGDDLAKTCFPDFDWNGYMIELARAAQVETDEEDVIFQFFSVAETLTVGSNPRVTSDHYKVEGDILYIYFYGLWQEVSKEMAHSRTSTEGFSKAAVIDRIREYEWFIAGQDRKCIGLENRQRRVLAIDLSKSPEYIRNFAKYSKEV